jgi:hypothetical protein
MPNFKVLPWIQSNQKQLDNGIPDGGKEVQNLLLLESVCALNISGAEEIRKVRSEAHDGVLVALSHVEYCVERTRIRFAIRRAYKVDSRKLNDGSRSGHGRADAG